MTEDFGKGKMLIGATTPKRFFVHKIQTIMQWHHLLMELKNWYPKITDTISNIYWNYKSRYGYTHHWLLMSWNLSMRWLGGNWLAYTKCSLTFWHSVEWHSIPLRANHFLNISIYLQLVFSIFNWSIKLIYNRC